MIEFYGSELHVNMKKKQKKGKTYDETFVRQD